MAALAADAFTSPPSTSELERFAELQKRLPGLWADTHGRADTFHTSVVVPSLSFDEDELKKIEGAACYEERLLFSLIRLRHPSARVLYVTSQPIHPEIIDYYLHLLVGVPAGHARRRLGLLCLYDGSPEPLSKRILARPRVIERMRHWIGDTSRAYLTCFNSTRLEQRLALALGIPLNAADPALLRWGTKSGSREAFAKAGVPFPPGTENVHSEADVLDALEKLTTRNPPPKKAVVKLDAGFSGEGNAVYTFPHPLPTSSRRRDALASRLKVMGWSAPDETYQRFMTKLASMGGIVEAFVEGDEVRSPSVQMRITPSGEVKIVSTHDQILGGPTGQVYLGCRFPADPQYRAIITEEALKVGAELAKLGVVSRFAMDFVVTRTGAGAWKPHAIEINLRMGGTTHPFLALQFLTGGELDTKTGEFMTPRGEVRCYRSTDALKSPAYRGLLPEDLMDILVSDGLQFRPHTETGTLFHLIGALSQYGKVGVTCIGRTPAEADEFWAGTVASLDRATGATVGTGGREMGLLDIHEGVGTPME